MSLQDKAEKYFSKLNPIAKRLHADLNDTKAAYDQLWSTLTVNEQNQILTESIIKPEVCLRYSLFKNDNDNKSNYALKVISDDNYTYRDEHSAPFSFRTPSQRDLRLFERTNENDNVSLIKSVSTVENNTKSESCDTNMSDSTLTSFPKTGLDLLDNW
ncbi:hypothetical protein RN001_007725 [Aquatica leii]|uniref:DUF4706 domain-containing protein n=1 Tax=Aquatica leii TaxID=1421715 RepID=A0AAN7P959_9COLE|nr:hypothetical protein RN001_007725 [Aquatica leii]